MKIIYLLLIYSFISLLCCSSLASAESDSRENFTDFLGKFFSDSTFQASRVVFPFRERINFIDAKTDQPVGTDKIAFASKENWIFMRYASGEKAAKHNIFDTGSHDKETNSTTSDQKTVEFYADESDYNLTLYFVRIDNSWFLIKKEHFEP